MNIKRFAIVIGMLLMSAQFASAGEPAPKSTCPFMNPTSLRANTAATSTNTATTTGPTGAAK